MGGPFAECGRGAPAATRSVADRAVQRGTRCGNCVHGCHLPSTDPIPGTLARGESNTRRRLISGVEEGPELPFTLAIRGFSTEAFSLVPSRVTVGPPVFTARMTNPMEDPDDPPPEEPENENPENEFAELDAREALFTAALQQADQVANRAEAMRRQVMLVGFDAMVLEEQAEGRAVHMDDVVVRAFVLHQSTVLRLPRQTVLRQLSEGWTLRDRLPNTWAVFLDGLLLDGRRGRRGERVRRPRGRARSRSTTAPQPSWCRRSGRACCCASSRPCATGSIRNR